VVVARRKEHHLFGLRRLDHAPRVGPDARAPREHTEVHRLEVGECVVGTLDQQHRLPRVDFLAVVQRVYDQLVPPLGAEFQDGDRLVDAAE